MKEEIKENAYVFEEGEGLDFITEDSEEKKRGISLWGILAVLCTFILIVAVGAFFYFSREPEPQIPPEIMQSLKDDAENEEPEENPIVYLTSEEAPWFYTDDRNRIYFEPELFSGKELIIPSVFDGRAVTLINGETFSKPNSTAEKLKISRGVKQIGDGAFKAFELLLEVEFPESLQRVTGSAFKGTPWYEGLSEDFTVVGKGVLIKYSGESESVEIPDNVNAIDCEAFSSISTAREIIIPKSTTYIGNKAFADCTAESIEIPSSVNYIENNAFEGSRYLEGYEGENLIVGDGCMISYEVVDSVITVPKEAKLLSGFDFSEEGQDLTLIIGENVSQIASLSKLGHIKAFEVDENSQNLSALDGVLYNSNQTVLYKYPVYKEGSDFSMPDSVYQIGTEAFMNSEIEKISLSPRLSTVGDRAFAACENLEEISFPQSVSRIGTSVFRDCRSLKRAELPFRMKYISKGLFQGCESLEEFEIKEKIQVIRGNAFQGCKSLKALHIPKGVTFVENNAFSGCEGLELTVDEYNSRYTLKNGTLAEKEEQ